MGSATPLPRPFAGSGLNVFTPYRLEPRLGPVNLQGSDDHQDHHHGRENYPAQVEHPAPDLLDLNMKSPNGAIQVHAVASHETLWHGLCDRNFRPAGASSYVSGDE
jgi:hypothetical protein